ncbi:HEPN domain-containing protein [Tissierella sp. MB52-C2]|uniref:HEPN domain-containing protein n=1 Tax=Tissierella sp. MB52-C2 TaxID=3070999 RepID=UPI00280C2C5D|nr:HEPN domain-containing protein [Tissierella sp. MB52-C2]WMM24206.1 HEPN domain-containing protein [Tissierella sp. MB52-C2]
MDNKNIRDLSTYRLIKSKEDLEASELLYDNNLFSQSLNRSYYSIFHSVRALLVYERVDFSKHSAIISYFNKNYIRNNKIDKKYSKILMGAEKLRNKSDYNDFFIVTKEDTYQQIINAKDFIDTIQKYIWNNYK